MTSIKQAEEKNIRVTYQQTKIVCSILLAEIKKVPKNNEKSAIILGLLKEALSRISAIKLLIQEKLWKESLVLWRSLYELECVATLLHRSENKKVINLYKELKRSKSPLTVLEKYDFKPKKVKDGWKSKENYKNYGWIVFVEGYDANKISFTFAGVQKLALLAQGKKEVYKYASSISHGSILAESKDAENKIKQVLNLTVEQIFMLLDENIKIDDEEYSTYKNNIR